MLRLQYPVGSARLILPRARRLSIRSSNFPALWQIDGFPGLWARWKAAKHFVPEYLIQMARLDDRAHRIATFYRAVEFEGEVAKALGRALASDATLAYCDDCGSETLAIVQVADGGVLCRGCFDLRSAGS